MRTLEIGFNERSEVIGHIYDLSRGLQGIISLAEDTTYYREKFDKVFRKLSTIIPEDGKEKYGKPQKRGDIWLAGTGGNLMINFTPSTEFQREFNRTYHQIQLGNLDFKLNTYLFISREFPEIEIQKDVKEILDWMEFSQCF